MCGHNDCDFFISRAFVSFYERDVTFFVFLDLFTTGFIQGLHENHPADFRLVVPEPDLFMMLF